MEDGKGERRNGEDAGNSIDQKISYENSGYMKN